MKVADILNITTDYTTIKIYNLAGELVTMYDGKNSIDKEYNTADIVQITATDKGLIIYINA